MQKSAVDVDALSLLLAEKVCEGLEYAHLAKDENGNPLHLVHRDLSPANVRGTAGEPSAQEVEEGAPEEGADLALRQARAA